MDLVFLTFLLLSAPVEKCSSIASLIRQDESELSKVSVIELNLTVAKGVCNISNNVEYAQHVESLARAIQLNISANEDFFLSNTELFDGSREKWIAVLMWQVLLEDFGIQYVPGGTVAVNHANPQHKFIHGLLDTRVGTCCTLPVLYLAIAQELEFPIKAVQTPTHMLCRWDDGKGVRFNIETTSRKGMTFPTDEQIAEFSGCTRQQVAEGMLDSLSSRELLGHFLLLRSDFHIANEAWSDARADLMMALQCAPGNPIVLHNLESVESRLRTLSRVPEQ